MNQTDFWTLGVIAGLAAVTVITRCFFFLSAREWSLPHWAQRGLQYAPIAALCGVIVPEIVMSQGALLHTWGDARPYAAAVGAAWYFWQRRSSWALLGTIGAGMAVYLPLHLGLGW
jgi:branched-subunit amino acid transport protein